MKTTTKLLAAAAAMACAMPAMADNHSSGDDYRLAIHHVHVKMGHGPDFRAGMEAYAKCLGENDYDGSYSVWQAVDGDRTGYHIVARFDMWAEMDESDPASDACWGDDDIRNGVFSNMASWETHYAKRMPEWSGNAEDYTVVKLHNFRVEDDDKFRALVGQLSGYMIEGKSEHVGSWYNVDTAGYWQADYFVVDHFDNFAAMDAKRKGVNDFLREAIGEEKADELWDDFGDALADEKGYWVNTLQLQDSLGYSSDED